MAHHYNKVTLLIPTTVNILPILRSYFFLPLLPGYIVFFSGAVAGLWLKHLLGDSGHGVSSCKTLIPRVKQCLIQEQQEG